MTELNTDARLAAGTGTFARKKPLQVARSLHRYRAYRVAGILCSIATISRCGSRSQQQGLAHATAAHFFIHHENEDSCYES